MSQYFTRRLVVVHVIALLAIYVCLAAAQWQWQRAHVSVTKDSSTANGDFFKLSPLRQHLPAESVAVKTSVVGTWLPDGRFEMPARSPLGKMLADPTTSARICSWVVDLVELEDESALAVVTGCTQDIGSVPRAEGLVTITGVLQPSEDSGAQEIYGVPSLLTTDEILKHTDLIVHDGYLVATRGLFGMQTVTPVIDYPLRSPVHWRNLIYVFNWIVFALILLAMWRRVVLDEVSDSKSGS